MSSKIWTIIYVYTNNKYHQYPHIIITLIRLIPLFIYLSIDVQMNEILKLWRVITYTSRSIIIESTWKDRTPVTSKEDEINKPRGLAKAFNKGEIFSL